MPSDATVIETAAVTGAAGKSRTLVLWMEHPKKVARPRANARGCEDLFLGDHWSGPTRLSLIDVASATLVNTVEIRQSYDDPNDQKHSFAFPFFGPGDWYYVPTPNANHEGKPRVLNLRDLSGEGAAGQFPVFEYAACGVARSSVFGYSPKSDQVVQYPVEIIEAGKKPQRSLWGPEFFRGRSVGPGRWDFTWEPGHGCFCSIRDQVSFDPARQLFVDRQTVTRQVIAPTPKRTADRSK